MNQNEKIASAGQQSRFKMAPQNSPIQKRANSITKCAERER
jgi:hypothetical protein